MLNIPTRKTFFLFFPAGFINPSMAVQIQITVEHCSGPFLISRDSLDSFSIRRGERRLRQPFPSTFRELSLASSAEVTEEEPVDFFESSLPGG